MAGDTSANVPNGNFDARGKFTKGNTVGRGNPFARRVARFKAAALQAVTPQDLQAVVRRLVEAAKQGDTAAARVILPYLVGKPEGAVEVDRVLTPTAVNRPKALTSVAIVQALESTWSRYEAGMISGQQARQQAELLLVVLRARQCADIDRKLDAIQAALEARQE
jgi:hypothetical protein